MKSLLKKKVLVVDDDTRMCRALDKVLTSEGAEVACAPWVGEAIEILTERRQKFDLVITDLRLPVVSGITAVYAIHKIFPDLPIIVLTAFGSPDVRAECLQQGARALLEKPMNTNQLVSIINQVFHHQDTGTDGIAEDWIESGGEMDHENYRGKRSNEERKSHV